MLTTLDANANLEFSARLSAFRGILLLFSWIIRYQLPALRLSFIYYMLGKKLKQADKLLFLILDK